MPLQALVLSHDEDVLRIVRRVLNDLGMRVEACSSAEPAADWVERRKFDVAVVDVDGAPGAAAVMNEIRQSSSNRNTVTFAILGGVTSPKQAFDMGANLALEKPLSIDRAVRGFRAANVLIAGERRHFFRYSVEMAVTVLVGNDEIEAKASTISESGLGLRVGKPLPAGIPVQVRFKLPGSKNLITSGAIVVWSDAEGAAGLRFEQFPANALDEFNRWAAEHGRSSEQA